MGNFNRGGNRFGRDRGESRFGGRDSGRSDFAKKSWGGHGGDRDRERVMHKATCSDCGNTCEVPFRPTGDKPVYCNDCFGGKRNVSEGRAPFARKDFGDRNDRGSSRPSFENNRGDNKGGDDIKKQFETMNAKIDRLIKAVDNLVFAKTITPDAKPIAPAIKPVNKKEDKKEEIVVKKENSKIVAKSAAKKSVEKKKKK